MRSRLELRHGRATPVSTPATIDAPALVPATRSLDGVACDRHRVHVVDLKTQDGLEDEIGMRTTVSFALGASVRSTSSSQPSVATSRVCVVAEKPVVRHTRTSRPAAHGARPPLRAAAPPPIRLSSRRTPIRRPGCARCRALLVADEDAAEHLDLRLAHRRSAPGRALVEVEAGVVPTASRAAWKAPSTAPSSRTVVPAMSSTASLIPVTRHDRRNVAAVPLRGHRWRTKIRSRTRRGPRVGGWAARGQRTGPVAPAPMHGGSFDGAGNPRSGGRSVGGTACPAGFRFLYTLSNVSSDDSPH